LRAVDGLCSAKDWEGLLGLWDLCMDAVDRGKQLWPISAHIDYRIALEAPGEYAGSVVDSDLTRFVPGPLTEVAASTHQWNELADHIEDSQAAAYVAQERVLRGEDLTSDGRIRRDVLELPLRLWDWEPTYALATYLKNDVEIAEPWDPKVSLRSVDPAPSEKLDASKLVQALLDVVTPWTTESNGAAQAVVADGDAISAASLLTHGPFRIGELTLQEGLQRIGWAAADGGAYGRRRGAAFGRSTAWYVAALMVGVAWPADPDELADKAGQLRWFRWDEGEPEEGWVLRLAIHDPRAGWSAAIAATDFRQEDDQPNV
jgi:Family of unknown function (DUF6183)